MDVSIAIIDDHPVICHGLGGILIKYQGFTVAGEAGDWKTAIKLIEEKQPDVAILDITLQGLDGISLISRLHDVSRNLRIVMYTMHNSRDYIARSLQAGALAYVLKNDKTEELANAVKSVMNNRLYLSNSVSDEIALQVASGLKKVGEATSTLSPREYEVASLTAQGLSPDQIAETLFISTKTVRVHRTNIMHKLACSGVHELLLKLRHYFPQH